MRSRGRFLHGTAGWSYKDWVGPFYATGTKASSYLERYAESYPAVEVDSTFYRVPSQRSTTRWAAETPDGFLFSPKMVNTVTHELFLAGCDEPLTAWLDAMQPLGTKLGPCVLQFPYFRKDSGITLARFLERLLPFLDRLPKPEQFAVEIRNRRFLEPALLEALRDRRVPLVLVDHLYMPGPLEYMQMSDVLTATTIPIRMIGDRHGIEKITKTWGQVVVDRKERIQEWVQLITRGLGLGYDVNVFVNNHFAGHGPAIASTLADQVRATGEPERDS